MLTIIIRKYLMLFFISIDFIRFLINRFYIKSFIAVLLPLCFGLNTFTPITTTGNTISGLVDTCAQQFIAYGQRSTLNSTVSCYIEATYNVNFTTAID
jgi:hypothetical protein